MTNELDTASLTGLLEFLSYEGKTGNDDRRSYAYETLRGIIENLPSAVITFDDAVTIQALGLTIVQSVIADLSGAADLGPERVALVRMAMSHLLIILQKAGTALEVFSGATIADRQFFNDQTPTTMQ